MDQEPSKLKPKKTSWKRTGANIFASIVIFAVGWGFGSGAITFTSGGQNSGLPENLDYTGVEEVYDALRKNYDGKLDLQTIQDDMKRGVAKSAGDPYTEYLTAEESKEFDAELEGSFTGIGAELSEEDGSIIVIAPLSGYPAEKAGLRARDVIVEIDEKSARDISVTEAVKRIRGPKGTVVKLKVIRGGSEEIDLEIERDNISIPSVEYEITDENIGVMTVSRFGSDTAALAEAAAEAFVEANVTGVVVDVRNNPGGLLDASVDVADLWLEDSTVLTERRGGTTIKTYTSESDALLKDVPTVVLINEGSASASEILAGALNDNQAAVLVGQTSFGKGSVQRLDALRTGGTLKVTIARWFTPEGKNIDKDGIKPDEKVKMTEKDYQNDRDPQLDAAIDRLQ